MSLLARCMDLLWTSLSTATDYFGRIISACGMPFALFITLITALFVINILFVGYRYRTIGEVMGDRAETFSESEHDRNFDAYVKSRTNVVIYDRLKAKTRG